MEALKHPGSTGRAAYVDLNCSGCFVWPKKIIWLGSLESPSATRTGGDASFICPSNGSDIADTNEKFTDSKWKWNYDNSLVGKHLKLARRLETVINNSSLLPLCKTGNLCVTDPCFKGAMNPDRASERTTGRHVETNKRRWRPNLRSSKFVVGESFDWLSRQAKAQWRSGLTPEITQRGDILERRDGSGKGSCAAWPAWVHFSWDPQFLSLEVPRQI